MHRAPRKPLPAGGSTSQALQLASRRKAGDIHPGLPVSASVSRGPATERTRGSRTVPIVRGVLAGPHGASGSRFLPSETPGYRGCRGVFQPSGYRGVVLNPRTPVHRYRAPPQNPRAPRGPGYLRGPNPCVFAHDPGPGKRGTTPGRTDQPDGRSETTGGTGCTVSERADHSGGDVSRPHLPEVGFLAQNGIRAGEDRVRRHRRIARGKGGERSLGRSIPHHVTPFHRPADAAAPGPCPDMKKADVGWTPREVILRIRRPPSRGGISPRSST